ncbi:hypothetical protein SAMN05444920_103437 [Nonomuraea solani]|uniref:Uncharacterized protein n=1 Tax=Nonomuraea solani TaxID=1144553 RepID=A0A1H6BKE1_9ACTN|nr:hypothetical protein [Nonomuraea solani]SEG60837.1 hypothetical protein SAMN05444920_103437 [Nonomuraea solani]
MSEEEPTRRPTVIVPHIAWVRRSDNMEYGMMGSIKAFSIHFFLNRYNLNPRLPGCTGIAMQGGEFMTADDAREAAEEIRNEWRKSLAAPYEGQLKEAS